MYKAASSNAHFLDRTGSHATKPARSQTHSPSGKDGTGELIRRIEQLQYGEAREKQSDLKAKLSRLQELYKGEISQGQRAWNGREIERINFELGLLKRHIGNLHGAADSSSDYRAFLRAIDEICDSETAARVLQRKIEIQEELSDCLGERAKPSGRKRKAVHLRGGGTMEQAIRSAMKLRDTAA